MMYTFPTAEEWNLIASSLDYSRCRIDPKDIRRPTNDIKNLFVDQELSNWGHHFNNRIGDVRKCHAFLLFYFGTGFPDDKWYSSPGSKGQTVSYFDSFTDSDFYRKDMFDLFVNCYFFNVFSSMDTIGQILNIFYDLGLGTQQVTFNWVIPKLKDVNPELYGVLEELQSSDGYKQLGRFRNEIAHQYLPNSIGSLVERFPNGKGMALTIGKYVSSRVVMEKINLAFEILGRMISALSQIHVGSCGGKDGEKLAGRAKDCDYHRPD